MARRSAWVLALAVSLFVVAASSAVRAADAGKAKDDQKAAKPVVAVFRLSGPMVETPQGEEPFALFSEPGAALKVVVQRINQAAADPQVKAVVLQCDEAGFGRAQAQEVRQALARVRDAGKDVYAHSDSFGMSEFLLLSDATRLSVTPTADLWLIGLYGEQPYLRGLLDKLGVTPEFLTCGEYKSAVEIFMRKEPSPAADKMTNWLLDSIYDTYLNDVAKSRKVEKEKVKKWIDEGPYTAERAKAAGIIDAVEHRQEFEANIRKKLGEEVTFDKRYGQPKQPQMDFSSPMAIFKLWADLLGASAPKKGSGKDAVGIVFVEGPIILGKAETSPFMGVQSVAASSDVRRALDKAAEDPTIKAVVLRVDSPGGSAVASEIILDATKRLKAKKPFVVSMGDVAGSGGYYVACGADTIYADEMTITGSIGVLGGKFVTNPMWDKVGISFKEYKRGEHADLLSSARPWTDAERQRMQGWMDEIYGEFKKHVTDIRGNRLKKPIDELAGGRVYTGKQALELGLVDKMGTLQDAIEQAAKDAKLKEGYEVRPVPEPKNFLEVLMAGAGGGDDEDMKRLDTTGVRVRGLAGGDGTSVLEMALPYLKGLDPQRVEQVKLALARLELMQREGAVLMMPEVPVRR